MLFISADYRPRIRWREVRKMPHCNLCHDVLCSMFLPRARDEVCNYYRRFLSVKPCLKFYCVKLVNLRHSPCEGSKYIIDFDLYPYIDAHITIAVCRMTICVESWDGDVKLVEFRQLRSYPVPQHLWDCVLQPF